MQFNKLLLFAGAALLSLQLSAQTLTQTVRGTVVDVDSKYPLPGAMVRVGDQTVQTDEYGQFTLRNVPIGRQTVVVNMFGYESRNQAIELNSAKEAVLQFGLLESSVSLEEVSVTATA